MNSTKLMQDLMKELKDIQIKECEYCRCKIANDNYAVLVYLKTGYCSYDCLQEDYQTYRSTLS